MRGTGTAVAAQARLVSMWAQAVPAQGQGCDDLGPLGAERHLDTATLLLADSSLRRTIALRGLIASLCLHREPLPASQASTRGIDAPNWPRRTSVGATQHLGEPKSASRLTASKPMPLTRTLRALLSLKAAPHLLKSVFERRSKHLRLLAGNRFKLGRARPKRRKAEGRAGSRQFMQEAARLTQ